MNISLTIDDTLWGYALAATAAQKADPIAQATQVVNDYCRACGNQMGLTPQVQLAAAVSKLTDAQVATLVPSAVALAPAKVGQ